MAARAGAGAAVSGARGAAGAAGNPVGVPNDNNNNNNNNNNSYKIKNYKNHNNNDNNDRYYILHYIILRYITLACQECRTRTPAPPWGRRTPERPRSRRPPPRCGRQTPGRASTRPRCGRRCRHSPPAWHSDLGPWCPPRARCAHSASSDASEAWTSRCAVPPTGSPSSGAGSLAACMSRRAARAP